MTELIPGNPRKPRSPRRLLTRTLSGIARVLLIAALAAFAIGLVLLVAWWQLLAIPYRRLQPERRHLARKEAALALITAAAAAAAAFRAGRQPA